MLQPLKLLFENTNEVISYLNPRFFRLRTSLYRVMISGKKLTFSFSMVPVLLERARTDSIAKIRPETPRLRCWTYGEKIWFTSVKEIMTLFSKYYGCLSYLASPIIKDFLGIQFKTETVTIGFQFLTFNVILPSFTYSTLNKMIRIK